MRSNLASMIATLSTLPALAACGGADLGTCDMTAATETTYYLDGVPYYAGQAIVHQSCAGSFCHAAGAKNDARIGAPHGIDFDVRPLGAASSAKDVSVLRSGIDQIREAADEMYELVDGGEMPPGRAGKRDPLPWHTASAGALVATALPDVRSKQGKDVLRNWLACDAPIVAYTHPDAPGQAEKLGVLEPEIATTIEPTFAGVYAGVLGGSCKSCHNGDAENPFAGQQALVFDSEEAAYDSLVGPSALSGGACSGRELVVPGDCQGSLLYQKLLFENEGAASFCGSPMPLAGAPLSQAAKDAVCQWIDAGALR